MLVLTVPKGVIDCGLLERMQLVKTLTRREILCEEYIPGSVVSVINTPSDLPYRLLLDNLIVYFVAGSKSSIIIPVRVYGTVCTTVKLLDVSFFRSMV